MYLYLFDLFNSTNAWRTSFLFFEVTSYGGTLLLLLIFYGEIVLAFPFQSFGIVVVRLVVLT